MDRVQSIPDMKRLVIKRKQRILSNHQVRHIGFSTACGETSSTNSIHYIDIQESSEDIIPSVYTFQVNAINNAHQYQLWCAGMLRGYQSSKQATRCGMLPLLGLSHSKIKLSLAKLDLMQKSEQ